MLDGHCNGILVPNNQSMRKIIPLKVAIADVAMTCFSKKSTINLVNLEYECEAHDTFFNYR